MIRCHLSRLMGEHKMNIVDVARAIDSNRSTIAALYHETSQRVELQAIEKLCALFKCNVGDLFEYTPDTADERKAD